MKQEEFDLALSSVQLIASQGRCRKGHLSARIKTLRTAQAHATIHIWQDCPVCGKGKPPRQLPINAEQAILLLERAGKTNRQNIRNLLGLKPQ